MTHPAAAHWDAEAARFDEEPDHGLGDPTTRAAWRDLLRTVLPEPPARVADLGCGTGSLSVLLAEDGHDVTGVDVSPAMLVRARDKAAETGVGVALVEGDAADPPLVPAYDVVLCRHVLWALPDPAEVLGRWSRLLAPGGALVLVEGRWGTGAGFTAEETARLCAGAGLVADVRPLSDPALWGRTVTDERYLVVASAR